MNRATGWRIAVLQAALCLALAVAAGAGSVPFAAETYDAPLDTRKDAKVAFAAKPAVKAEGSRFLVRFELSAPTDVEVAVIQPGGKVVRHLAAGLLGKNAPAPFKKDVLAQELAWDGNDDAGKPVAGPCQVRISAGAQPKLDRIAGWNGNTLTGIVSLATGANGELFVLTSEAYRGGTDMYVLDRNGKYLRTIIPYPAHTPPERLASVGQIKLDGESLPTVLNAVARTLYPLLNGVRQQNMAVHPKGHLILMSGLGTLSEHGPPRHLLALHPEGGAPEGVPFVGPQVRKPRGFMGGAGEGPAGLFEHLAVSPDGEYVYLAVSPLGRLDGKNHGVLRFKWNDKEAGALFLGRNEPGTGDGQFNTPEGLATDAKGNLYVCDWGNNRVAIFAPDGKPAGKFAVEQPQQICVHPRSGEIYVLSAGQKQSWMRLWETKAVVRKFAAWTGSPPQERARFEHQDVALMALDASGPEPRLWLSGKDLFPVDDRGARLEAGPAVNNNLGMICPWFVAGDPERKAAFIYERATFGGNPTVVRLDLETGKKANFCGGTNLTVDQDGNAYVLGGRDSTIYRFDPAGKPLPFSALNSHKIVTKGYRGFGPNLGIPGIAVSPAGDIYVMRTSNYGKADSYGGRIDVYGPDGKMKKENIVDGLGFGDCGLGVDAAGNVYVGSNLKSAAKPLPDEFMGKAPDTPWIWWKSSREAPWCYPHLNTYLFYWGSVFKFGPGGGVFYGQAPWNLKNKEYGPPKSADDLANAPPGAVSYRSAYLGYEVKAAGALWRYHGMGVMPASGDGLMPDPGCICHNSRMGVDPYGRVYVPDVFRFSVGMLDTNGNRIARIGHYGNADSAGPGSKVPQPEIAFAWPTFVSINQGKLLVSDPVNRRVVIVRFDYQATETVTVR